MATTKKSVVGLEINLISAWYSNSGPLLELKITLYKCTSLTESREWETQILEVEEASKAATR